MLAENPASWAWTSDMENRGHFQSDRSKESATFWEYIDRHKWKCTECEKETKTSDLGC